LCSKASKCTWVDSRIENGHDHSTSVTLRLLLHFGTVVEFDVSQ